MKPTWKSNEAIEKGKKGTFAAKAVRKDVFYSNKEIFAAGGYTTESGQDVTLQNSAMLEGSIFATDAFELPATAELFETETGTANIGCLEMAKALIDRGMKPAVLNLADAYLACGFYQGGSSAQEESLCRQSNLSQSLSQWYTPTAAKNASVTHKGRLYPMDIRYGGIYTPHATVFREGQHRGFRLMEEPYEVGFISVAALSFNEKHRNDLQYRNDYGGLTDEGKEIMRCKIRTIYRLGAQGGHDALVLGAFGCGAFRLIPMEVATLFKEVLDEPEFKGRFKGVYFAILSSVEDMNRKFGPFYRIFGRMQN